MPRLWSATIDAHRHAVREAILDTTWALTSEHGLTAVTMSRIAEKTGIGRATLYKYFPDVEAILLAWHERQIAGHLQQLVDVGRTAGDHDQRLEAVLKAYALIAHERQHHGAELGALLHGGGQTAHAQQHLQGFVTDLLAQAAATGGVRDDIAPDELAGFCLHALTAAGGLASEAAVRRLVTVTLAGLRPQH